MGVFRQFPYSNFHEMNLDEMIKIIKNMLEEWAQYHAEWDSWMNQMNDDWSNYQEVMNEAWQNMQNFINNYFDNLDVQNEINAKITSMVNSGEFATIVEPYIPPRVTAWLTEHITQPEGVVIDTSLTVSGACADAKATGDAINDIKSDYSLLGSFMHRDVPSGNYYIPFSFKANHTYIFINLSDNSGNFNLILRETRTGENLQEIYGLAQGTTKEFVANHDANWMVGWHADAKSFTLIDKDSAIVQWNDYANEIKSIESLKIAPKLINGGYIISDGTITPNQYFTYTDYIDVSEFGKIRIVNPNETLNYCAWYDSSKTFISRFTVAQGDTTKVAPANAKYCRISSTTTNMEGVEYYTALYFSGLQFIPELHPIKNAVSSLEDGYLISNNLNGVEWEQGGFDSSDVDFSSNYYVRSNYIYVGNLDGISYNTTDEHYIMWHSYDINKNQIEQRRIWSRYGEVPVDDNVAYIRLLLQSDNVTVSAADVPTVLTIWGRNKYGESIPNYWLSTLESKIATVRGLQKTCGTRGDEFVYITDYHDSRMSFYNCNVSISMIERIMRKTSTRFVLFGGDGFDHEASIVAYREGAYNFYDKFNFLKAGQFYPVIGNHEFYSNLGGTPDDVMTADEAYNIYLKRYESFFIDTDFTKSYCFDNTVQKIRYFVLGCDYDSVMSNNQIEWLMNHLLNLPLGYSIVVITHSGLYFDQEAPFTPLIDESFQLILDGLDALKEGWPTTINGITYDFTDKARDVICALSGHNHRDMATTTETGIPVIGRAADTLASEVLAHEKGTITEQAFDIVNIDMTNRKIYFTRIGAGNSAEFNY